MPDTNMLYAIGFVVLLMLVFGLGYAACNYNWIKDGKRLNKIGVSVVIVGTILAFFVSIFVTNER